MGVTDTGSAFPATGIYHDSCHALRGLGVSTAPRRLLTTVRGFTLLEPAGPPRCCGFGGTFSARFPEVSAAMAQDRLGELLAGGPDVVVAADPGCIFQMRSVLETTGRTDVRVLHVAEVLAGGTA
jgi:L-lactate dehydrogenase complex protein LldE